jgi:hypothetical protein
MGIKTIGYITRNLKLIRKGCRLTAYDGIRSAVEVYRRFEETFGINFLDEDNGSDFI